MTAFFNLIRHKNLLIIALTQLLLKFMLLEPFGVATSLNGSGMFLLIFATVCIAAAGNIINDIYDVDTDRINKPNKLIINKAIAEKTAYNLFIIFNILGVAAGYILSNMVNKAPFFGLFVIISVLLYVYASYLKRTFLIGNIIISMLVATSIIIVGVFELIPAITAYNKNIQFTFFKIILDYALFAFIINLLREISKDIEDIDGDYKSNMNTLPIVLGRSRAKNVLVALNFVPLAAIVYYIVNHLYKQPIAVVYFLIFIVAPLLYICIKTFNATHKKDFALLSNLYKLVMLFGILSLLLYKFVILK